jgi:tetratricopeptide (TPR) repeat protein
MHAGLARESRHPRHLRDAVAWEAMRAMLDGSPDDARAATDEALALGTRADDPAASTAFWTQRWWLALEWGTPDELPEVADACREEAAGGDDAGEWRASLALLLARRGQLDLAADELRRATAGPAAAGPRDPGRLHPLTSLAEVAWLVGDARRAAHLAPRLEPFAGHLVVVGRGLACRGSVARACALVAAANRRWAEADRQFKAALAVHQRIGARPLEARTHYERARVLLDRGRKVDARKAAESLRAAEELATALGMHRLLHDAQALRDR